MIDRKSSLGVVLCCWLSLMAMACDPANEPEPVSEDSNEMAELEQDKETPPFNYPGGWTEDGACVDICGVTAGSPVDRPPAVICFNPDDTECAAKTGEGDYDFFMLSQQWLPSFCMGLEAGYDSTVTHKAGARCQAHSPNRLTVHGLWPNYHAGFPQCCGQAEPMDPGLARAWPEILRQNLHAAQPDPTTSGFEPALCEIYNHEWQKHGTCLTAAPKEGSPAPSPEQRDVDVRAYFETGVAMAHKLADANQAMDAWAGSSQTRTAIEALYPKAIQVLCDKHHPERLLEVHTCWSRDQNMVDCTPTAGFGVLKACGDEVTLPEWKPEAKS